MCLVFVWVQEPGLTDGEASGNEEPDVTDEHAMLLHSGIILRPQAKTSGMSPHFVYKSGRSHRCLHAFLLFLYLTIIVE